MRVVVVALLAFSVVGLAACSDSGGPDAPPPGRPSATTPERPETRPTPGAEVTLRGTVTRGVEPNCLVLAAEGREYLLLETGPEVRPGLEVTVRGTVRPDVATTCMQGTPFVVDDVELVGGGST